MRRFAVVAAAFLVVQSAYASETLHTMPSAGLDFLKTENVENVVIDTGRDFVQFVLVDADIHATAFVFRDTTNHYPQLNAFSEQFLEVAYPGGGNSIAGRRSVQSKFANVVADGREYLIDSEKGTCELVLVSAVGDLSYANFRIADESSSAPCSESGGKLRAAAKAVTASVAAGVGWTANAELTDDFIAEAEQDIAKSFESLGVDGLKQQLIMPGMTTAQKNQFIDAAVKKMAKCMSTTALAYAEEHSLSAASLLRLLARRKLEDADGETMERLDTRDFMNRQDPCRQSFFDELESRSE